MVLKFRNVKKPDVPAYVGLFLCFEEIEELGWMSIFCSYFLNFKIQSDPEVTSYKTHSMPRSFFGLQKNHWWLKHFLIHLLNWLFNSVFTAISPEKPVAFPSDYVFPRILSSIMLMTKFNIKTKISPSIKRDIEVEKKVIMRTIGPQRNESQACINNSNWLNGF